MTDSLSEVWGRGTETTEEAKKKALLVIITVQYLIIAQYFSHVPYDFLGIQTEGVTKK